MAIAHRAGSFPTREMSPFSETLDAEAVQSLVKHILPAQEQGREGYALGPSRAVAVLAEDQVCR